MRMMLAVASSAALLGLAACGSTGQSSPSASVTAPRAAHTATVTPGKSPGPSPAPTVTKTATVPPPPVSGAPASPAGVQAKTPWAVVSEYYGDIESGDYASAYALLSSGSVTGQTYQQFAAGFACTSYENLTDLGTSGDTVTISLNAANACNGTDQQYQGTYTVQNGLITAASVAQTGG
jgi:hypothetical protein